MTTTEEIVDLQVRAANLQADLKRHLIPKENFFPRMIGWIAQTQGIEVARNIYTLFEMGTMDHAELMDDMMRHPRLVAKSIQTAARKRKA